MSDPEPVMQAPDAGTMAVMSAQSSWTGSTSQTCTS
jgi:hypothetical protein